MKMVSRPSRCKECKKIITPKNKSGLCNYHHVKILSTERRRKKCHICKGKCSGKRLIQFNGGRIFSFCNKHFKKLYLIKREKDIKLEIKRLKCLSLGG